MKQFLFIYLLIVINFFLPIQYCNSQNQLERELATIDSMKFELENLEGIEKIELMLKIADYYEYIDRDEVIKFAEKSLEYSENIDYKIGIVKSIRQLALGYYFKSKRDTAIELINKALDLAIKYNYKSGEGTIYHDIGIAFFDEGDYANARQYFNKALGINIELGHHLNISNIYNYLAIIGSNTGNFEMAANYYIKSIKLCEEINDTECIADQTFNLGTFYQEIKNYKKALEYYKKSIELYIALKDDWGIADGYNRIGSLYFDSANYVYAKELFIKSLNIYAQLNLHDAIAITCNQIGSVYLHTEKPDSAIIYFRKCLEKKFYEKNYSHSHTYTNLGLAYLQLNDFLSSLKCLNQSLHLAKQVESLILLMDCYEAFTLYYSKLKDYKKALENHKLFVVYKDSVYNIKSTEKVTEIEIRYQVEKKENEIERQKLEIEKQHLQKSRLYLGLGILILIAIFILYLFLSKRRTNKLLKSKIAEALEKQKEQQQIIVHQSSLTSLGEMAAGMAHEINQPLQSISFAQENIFFETNEEPSNKSFIQEKSKIIAENIGKIRRIMDHIRIFSSKQKDEINEKFNINNSIKDGLSMMRHQFLNRNISVNLNLSEDILPVIGNPYKFEQVVINLLTNARDAVDEKGGVDKYLHAKEVKIKTFQNKNEIILEIKDNGIGIPPDKQTNVFLPFYSTKKSGKGTGLGLSISRGIIKEMGGEIFLESKVGEGTKIIVKLPALSNE